jgi:hypothetical protein
MTENFHLVVVRLPAMLVVQPDRTEAVIIATTAKKSLLLIFIFFSSILAFTRGRLL